MCLKSVEWLLRLCFTNPFALVVFFGVIHKNVPILLKLHIKGKFGCNFCWELDEEKGKERGRRVESGEQDSWVGPIVLSETDLCSFSWLAVRACTHYRIMVRMAAQAESWAALASVPGTEGNPIEKQCDGHNGCDRLAASTGFLLLWLEINHKYPHWHPPTAHQASTQILTQSQTERAKKRKREDGKRGLYGVHWSTSHQGKEKKRKREKEPR